MLILTAGAHEQITSANGANTGLGHFAYRCLTWVLVRLLCAAQQSPPSQPVPLVDEQDSAQIIEDRHRGRFLGHEANLATHALMPGLDPHGQPPALGRVTGLTPLTSSL
jgi:hypothetical protein